MYTSKSYSRPALSFKQIYKVNKRDSTYATSDILTNIIPQRILYTSIRPSEVISNFDHVVAVTKTIHFHQKILIYMRILLVQNYSTTYINKYHQNGREATSEIGELHYIICTKLSPRFSGKNIHTNLASKLTLFFSILTQL